MDYESKICIAIVAIFVVSALIGWWLATGDDDDKNSKFPF